MAILPRADDLAAWCRETARAWTGRDPALVSVLSWIRTLALEDDVFYLDAPHESRLPGSPLPWRPRRGFFRFVSPSFPSSHPERVRTADALGRVRFVVRSNASGDCRLDASVPSDAAGETRSSWRPIVHVRGLVVFEKDAPHGQERPLRLGLTLEEGFAALAGARQAAQRLLAGERSSARSIVSKPEHPRLAQRSSVAVALWTRGRLRGSVILSPGPAARALGPAAVAACEDARFARLSVADLDETIFQIGFLHSPRVRLSRHEIETCDAYPDKALFVSEGVRSGAYLPEVFNVLGPSAAPLRTLVPRLAREKAGMSAIGPDARIEVNELTEFVESADRSRGVRLDGPVACVDDGPVRARGEAAGRAACAWLAGLQREDGSLPLFVRPSTGRCEGTDVSRTAMTADALAAFGAAIGLDRAVDTARGALAWLARSRSEWSQKRELALAATVYVGKASVRLGDESAVERCIVEVVDGLEGTDPGPLVLANALSFLERASARHPVAARRCEPLRADLAARFARARGSKAALSLAEWAELAAAFPADSPIARDVSEWLKRQQLRSGAFPESTASAFVYARGTGKVFEVLAVRPSESADAIDRALLWLLSMQYRADSVFFVPNEHRARVLGGLRHDPFRADAWIDAAGHLLLGLARLQES
jgi:AMMECR1 domain-containing protein